MLIHFGIGKEKVDFCDPGQDEIDSFLMDGSEKESDTVKNIGRPFVRDSRIEERSSRIGEKSNTMEKTKKKRRTKSGCFQFRPRNDRARNVHFQAETNHNVPEFLPGIGAQTC